MAHHHLYHGGGRTPQDVLFPQNVAGWAGDACADDCPMSIDPNAPMTTELLDAVRTEAAGHKIHVAYGLSRTLDFYPALIDTGYTLRQDCLLPTENTGRLQVGLQQYLACHPLAENDTIYPVVIPPDCFLLGVYWKVEVPEDGVTFTLGSVREGVPSTEIIGGAAASGWIAVGTWLPRADALALIVNTLPAEILTRLRLTVSAVVLCPDTGN
jgi:hypothetical protein